MRRALTLLGAFLCRHVASNDETDLAQLFKPPYTNNMHECETYMAPSTIPGAGMGLFAARDYAQDEYITSGDIVIPILDLQTHNEAIDTQMIVLQQYYWQTHAFTSMSEESVQGFAFSPGAGAAINCFFPLLNTQGYDEGVKVGSAGLHRSKDPGAGASTIFHGRTSYAIRPIRAGEELFTDYGELYFTLNEEDYGQIPLIPSYPLATELLNKYVAVRDSHQPMPVELNRDWYDLIVNLSQEVWPSRILNALPYKPDSVDWLAEVGTEWRDYNRSFRVQSEFYADGYCMDNIKEGQSNIDGAGRGAFATRFIPAGGLVGPAPLVHLERAVMHMYPLLYNDDGSIRADTKQTPIHDQLMLNYCFGHLQSSLLLCPYGALVNLINHSREKTNARVVWNYKASSHPEWLTQPLVQWQSEDHTGLHMDYVATKDIQKGEEVYIDYGDDWIAAWNEHVKDWQPPEGAEQYQPAYEMNDSDNNSELRTVSEGGYSGKEFVLLCRKIYLDFAGLRVKDAENEKHFCSVTNRYRKDGELRFTAELHGQSINNATKTCRQEFQGVVFDVPRDAFWFQDVPYSRDSHQTWSFRHSIGIPEDIFPSAWKNVNHGNYSQSYKESYEEYFL